MADKSAEKAQQTVRDATDAASETVGKASDTAREASENAARGYEELSTLGRTTWRAWREQIRRC